MKALRPGGDPLELRAEAAGLDWLRAAGAVPVPAVLSVTDDELVLEHVEGDGTPLDGERLGRELAALHAAGADGFGAPWPIRFGLLALDNEPAPSWAHFYAERRLRPLARRLGSRAAERVADRMEQLAGPPEPPARVHGDLWRGNVVCGPGGRGWLVDPWAHGGHREADLAMLGLFGEPAPGVLAAYREVAPLADGWQERVELWQLFPLLVHAVVFGGGYVDSVERVAGRYA